MNIRRSLTFISWLMKSHIHQLALMKSHIHQLTLMKSHIHQLALMNLKGHRPQNDTARPSGRAGDL